MVILMRRESTHIKILLVEDTVLTVAILTDLIQSVPYEVTLVVVDNEQDGVKSALDDHPDIIIIDLVLKKGLDSMSFDVLRTWTLNPQQLS